MQVDAVRKGDDEGPLIIFNAEYDALPKIGHACGHNLIATASISAFLATVKALQGCDKPYRIRLLGTPGEESGGAKVQFAKDGLYDGAICMMVHPGPDIGYTRGVARTHALATTVVTAAYEGKAAHASVAPWEGKNALDAAVSAYNSVAMLRQQTKPTNRISAVMEGGTAVNVIPDRAILKLGVRAETGDELVALETRLKRCLKAGAHAAGIKLSCDKITRCVVEYLAS
jgi:amidohydrolase